MQVEHLMRFKKFKDYHDDDDDDDDNDDDADNVDRQVNKKKNSTRQLFLSHVEMRK